jgi:hypothetical protein
MDIGEKPATEIIMEQRKKVAIMNLQCRVAQLELRKLEMKENLLKLEEEIIIVQTELTGKGG